MGEIKRVFESENIRVGFDEFMDNHERIVVASKDRGFMNGDKWVINHLWCGCMNQMINVQLKY